MQVHVNNQPRILEGDTTLSALVRDLGLAERRGIAVAVNDTVVARREWEKRALGEGDRVVLIQAAQGG